MTTQSTGGETTDSLTGSDVINVLMATVMDVTVTSSQPEDTVFN